MSVAASKIDPGANVFQEYLIPADSCSVRFVMQKAGHFARSSNPIEARLIPVGLAICAVAMSFFNAFSYLLLIPCKILVNIFSFSPIKLVKDIAKDFANVLRSALFVSLGVTFVVAGIIFPDAIFSHFAPEYYDPLEVRLRDRVEELELEREQFMSQLVSANETIEALTLRLEEPKEPPAKPKKCFWY